MKIDVLTAGSRVPDAQRQGVERRLRLALSRFGRGVERVTVRLSDVANPLGGVDTRCRMRAWLRLSGSVAVQTLDGSTAIDRAAARLAARVEWTLVNGRTELGTSRIPVAFPSHGLATSLRPARRRRRKAAAGRRKPRT